ncbi:MAG: cysteine desulfurase family protein [Eubacteriales bacterium]|nr:cysteine desulfurase family protein [Eubacteriales bacterium]
MECYLDNSATTRCLESAAELMAGIMCTEYGNPSSLHHKGVQAEEHLRHAREVIARSLKVAPKEIFFTSGGTESDNLALRGAAYANGRSGRHLITTSVEHPAVLNTMQYLEQQGYEVTYLPVGEDGRIRLSDLEAAIRPDTILVSVMHTNNEIGALQPIAEAGALIKRVNPNTLFHVDAVQGYGKSRILAKRLGIDMLSVSAHKIHGPKGIGFLYVGDRVKIRPILFGGGQERGLRSGTENVAGIAGMAKAAEEIYRNLDADVDRMYGLRERLAQGILGLENVRINGLPGRESAPHVLSASFAGVRSEVLLHALEEKQIYVSAGSACASNHPETSGSATLRAIGLPKELLGSTVRFSLSVFTTQEEIDYTVRTLRELVPMLRRFTRR